ncbi:MAG: hypothetical protein ABEL76_11885 [Bradymonadaceae bacterium]
MTASEPTETERLGPTGLYAALVLFTGLGVVQAACAGPQRTFDGEVVWHDNDRRPIDRPTPRQLSSTWEMVDNLLFRPLSEATHPDPPERAANANAMGGVPNSSWYTNRMTARPLPPRRVARGPCSREEIPSGGRWTLIAPRAGTDRPDFVAHHSDSPGRYVLRFGADDQPERATAADAIGARIYWAAGYHVPCNRVVYLDPEKELAVEGSPDWHDRFRTILDRAPKDARGRVRATAVRLPSHRELGPFQFEGTRPDDPNDVIPHENRRELRGSRLFAAWLGHVDAHPSHTTTTFVSRPDSRRGYVRHYFIDWTDCLGATPYSEELDRRLGHSYLVDIGQILGDYFTLGLLHRPWRTYAGEQLIFGYFDAEHFSPAKWRPSYPNPAFRHMRPGDAFWAASIIARFTDEHVRAIVERGRFSHPEHAEYVAEVLIERRDTIVEHYLGRMSPLVAPSIRDGRLCTTDLMVRHGYARPEKSRYEIAGRGGPWRRVGSVEGARVCTALKKDGASAYRVVRMRVRRSSEGGTARPVAFHVRQRPEGWAVAGIVRR